jgi:hypothetical protein
MLKLCFPHVLQIQCRMARYGSDTVQQKRDKIEKMSANIFGCFASFATCQPFLFLKVWLAFLVGGAKIRIDDQYRAFMEAALSNITADLYSLSPRRMQAICYPSHTDLGEISESSECKIIPRPRRSKTRCNLENLERSPPIFLSLNMLKAYFHLPLNDAAQSLGVCCTALKK